MPSIFSQTNLKRTPMLVWFFVLLFPGDFGEDTNPHPSEPRQCVGSFAPGLGSTDPSLSSDWPKVTSNSLMLSTKMVQTQKQDKTKSLSYQTQSHKMIQTQSHKLVQKLEREHESSHALGVAWTIFRHGLSDRGNPLEKTPRDTFKVVDSNDLTSS